MAFTKLGVMYARNSGADLSASLNRLAKVDTDGDLILATAGDAAIGPIYEAAALDKPTTVQLTGIAKIICGGTIAAGARVASDANAAIVAAAIGNYEVGTALEAGAAGRVISVALLSGRAHA